MKGGVKRYVASSRKSEQQKSTSLASLRVQLLLRLLQAAQGASPPPAPKPSCNPWQPVWQNGRRKSGEGSSIKG